MNISCTFKVSIVGCGNVGATAAYSFVLDGIVTDLTLIDVQKERAQGIILDMEHCLPFTSYVKLQATDDFEVCAGSDLVVITAGRGQKQGETRLDLIKANREIFKDIVPKIIKAAPEAKILVVTNPVDVLTYEAIKLSGLDKGQIFGSGTILDTARLQFHVSEKLKISPKSIDAYVFGEHGDSSFPVWSSANITGKRLLDFENFSQKEADECYEKTRTAAYRIINDVGYTCYSIATAAREIVRAIAADSNQIFMLSTLLKDYYGHSDVCMSVPCVLGRNGIVKSLTIPLDEKELEKLAKSVEVLKGFYG